MVPQPWPRTTWGWGFHLREGTQQYTGAARRPGCDLFQLRVRPRRECSAIAEICYRFRLSRLGDAVGCSELGAGILRSRTRFGIVWDGSGAQRDIAAAEARRGFQSAEMVDAQNLFKSGRNLTGEVEFAQSDT